MPLKELAVQSKLVKAAMQFGGHAYKTNNRFVKGVLDLSIKLPSFPHVLLEVKMGKSSTLTPHQRNFMLAHQRAGGAAGWVRVWPIDNVGGYRLRYSVKEDMDVWDECDRLRNYQWPVENIVYHIAKVLKCT